MKSKGPIATLGAVAVLGTGLWLVNVNQTPDATPPRPTAAANSSAVPAPPPVPVPPAPPAADPFPAKADYVGKIPTAAGTITLEITVDGNRAVAYACDGRSVEVWLRGTAEAGVVKLTSKDNTSSLVGEHRGTTVAGTLSIGEKSWKFTTSAVEQPAGLNVDTAGGVRNSWIVGADGSVTGVQRRADGSTVPAPALDAGSAVRVDGATDVS